VSPVKSITVTGLSADGSLAPSAILTVNVVRTVQPGDPDGPEGTPQDGTPSTTTFTFTPNANFTGSPDTAVASHLVNPSQPKATLTETASPTTTPNQNQPTTYTFTVNNTSPADSPNLVLDPNNVNDSFTDTLLGNLEPAAIAAMPIHDANGAGEVAPG